MPIRLGNQNIGKLYVGRTLIGKAYRGTTLVYQLNNSSPVVDVPQYWPDGFRIEPDDIDLFGYSSPYGDWYWDGTMTPVKDRSITDELTDSERLLPHYIRLTDNTSMVFVRTTAGTYYITFQPESGSAYGSLTGSNDRFTDSDTLSMMTFMQKFIWYSISSEDGSIKYTQLPARHLVISGIENTDMLSNANGQYTLRTDLRTMLDGAIVYKHDTASWYLLCGFNQDKQYPAASVSPDYHTDMSTHAGIAFSNMPFYSGYLDNENVRSIVTAGQLMASDRIERVMADDYNYVNPSMMIVPSLPEVNQTQKNYQISGFTGDYANLNGNYLYYTEQSTTTGNLPVWRLSVDNEYRYITWREINGNTIPVITTGTDGTEQPILYFKSNNRYPAHNAFTGNWGLIPDVMAADPVSQRTTSVWYYDN